MTGTLEAVSDLGVEKYGLLRLQDRSESTILRFSSKLKFRPNYTSYRLTEFVTPG